MVANIEIDAQFELMISGRVLSQVL